MPCAGAPGALGAIRTIGNGKFVDGVAEPVHGDTWFAVIEFEQSGAKAEALLGYLLRGTSMSSKSFQLPLYLPLFTTCVLAAEQVRQLVEGREQARRGPDGPDEPERAAAGVARAGGGGGQPGEPDRAHALTARWRLRALLVPYILARSKLLCCKEMRVGGDTRYLSR